MSMTAHELVAALKHAIGAAGNGGIGNSDVEVLDDDGNLYEVDEVVWDDEVGKFIVRGVWTGE